MEVPEHHRPGCSSEGSHVPPCRREPPKRRRVTFKYPVCEKHNISDTDYVAVNKRPCQFFDFADTDQNSPQVEVFDMDRDDAGDEPAVGDIVGGDDGSCDDWLAFG